MMNERRRMDAAAELDFPLPSVEEVANISRSSFAYQLPDHQLPSYHRYVCSVLLACAGLRKFDLEKGEDNIDHNRNNASPPKAGPSSVCSTKEASSSDVARSYTAVTSKEEENPLGAWSVKCNLSIPIPIPIPAVAGEGEGEQKEESGLWRALKGKRVVIKDNIPIRGLPMYCGTSFFFTPLMDSPLVTRCLEAGATIVGTAQCEYMCFTASSHTASSGLVRNPIAPDYHAGGSSSGCAALVSARKADLSIGCDQGGSIRIPAAMCGVVGCKPTHGLVPYTYIDGMYGPIDHAGPITRTVEDNALMLGVLAGWDGVDERPSPAARSMKKVDYCKHLKEGVKGMRVGLVTEAITMPLVEDDVKKAIEDSAQVLREVGAEVDAISMPLLFTSAGIWVLSVLPSLVQKLFYSKEKDPLSGVDEHGKVYDRLTFLRENLLANVASWSIMFRINIIAGEWLRMRFPEALMVADVHKQRLIESYCSALSEFDVLLFPTTARKSKKLTTHLSTAHDYEHASAELLAKHVHMAEGMTTFATCSNLTGHPAVSVPVGGGLAKLGEDQDGEAPILSIGAMLVGNYFQEASLYRVAYALEQARCQHLQPHQKQ